jgi:myo-inositol 2-dehydrogenase/D-chiro-inositol 1-dehydrogenase
MVIHSLNFEFETSTRRRGTNLCHDFLLADFTGNADMPYDFFLSRYNEAYVTETIAFCESLVNDSPVPCTGQDGLVALIMAIAADKSAAENRWVKFNEIIESVYCRTPTECDLVATSEVFPEGFRPVSKPSELLLPDVDAQKANPSIIEKFSSWFN